MNDLVKIKLPENIEIMPDSKCLEFKPKDYYEKIYEKKIKELEKKYWEDRKNLIANSKDEKFGQVNDYFEKGYKPKLNKELVKLSKVFRTERNRLDQDLRSNNRYHGGFTQFVDKYNSEQEFLNKMKVKQIKKMLSNFRNLLRSKENKKFKYPLTIRKIAKVRIKVLKEEYNKRFLDLSYFNRIELEKVIQICEEYNIPYKKYIVVDEDEKITVHFKITALLSNYIEVNNEVFEKEDKDYLISFCKVVTWIFQEIDESDTRDYNTKMNDYVKFLIKLVNNIDNYEKV